MWIFCGGMQRAASTLQYQVASEIVEHYGLGYRLTWYDSKEHDRIIDEHNENSDYKVFKSHIYSNKIKEQFNKRNAIGLYIYRDVRDVVSSLKEKNNTDYDDAHLKVLVNNVISQYHEWNNSPYVYMSRYENVINSLKSEIISIGKFIGVLLDNDFINECEKKFSLQKQKELIIRCSLSDSLVTVNKTNIYEPVSLLHMNHISSGLVGRYKSNISIEQLDIITTIAKDWLQNNGYEN
jgi:hypothetical protein